MNSSLIYSFFSPVHRRNRSSAACWVWSGNARTSQLPRRKWRIIFTINDLVYSPWLLESNPNIFAIKWLWWDPVLLCVTTAFFLFCFVLFFFYLHALSQVRKQKCKVKYPWIHSVSPHLLFFLLSDDCWVILVYFWSVLFYRCEKYNAVGRQITKQLDNDVMLCIFFTVLVLAGVIFILVAVFVFLFFF